MTTTNRPSRNGIECQNCGRVWETPNLKLFPGTLLAITCKLPAIVILHCLAIPVRLLPRSIMGKQTFPIKETLYQTAQDLIAEVTAKLAPYNSSEEIMARLKEGTYPPTRCRGCSTAEPDLAKEIKARLKIENEEAYRRGYLKGLAKGSAYRIAKMPPSEREASLAELPQTIRQKVADRIAEQERNST